MRIEKRIFKGVRTSQDNWKVQPQLNKTSDFLTKTKALLSSYPVMVV